MGFLDDVTGEVKKKPDHHYRLTSADAGKHTRRKIQGYENVSPTDSEIKGTIAEKMISSDGTVRIGNLILQRTSKDNHERLKKQLEAKNQARIDAIKRKYQDDGERLKRSLGKHHDGLKIIAESKDD
jgi:hypothetical protein